MRRLFLLAFLPFLLFARPTWADEPDISYGPDPQEQLDVCTPPNPVAQAPAVLMIHGGGWRKGSRRGLTGPCRLLAQQGIVVFVADYRLATPDPATKWPVQIEDAQLAMRWARAHAASFGVNPAHICAEGDSAGGQLALMLDVLAAIHPGDRANLLSQISPRADCVVDISGIADLLSIETAHVRYANFLIGGSDEALLKQQKLDGSAALHVGPGDGNALLIHGLDDPLVPFDQAEEMRDSLVRAGADAWLISHRGGHELNGMTPLQAHGIWSVIAAFIKARELPFAHTVRVDDVLP